MNIIQGSFFPHWNRLIPTLALSSRYHSNWRPSRVNYSFLWCSEFLSNWMFWGCFWILWVRHGHNLRLLPTKSFLFYVRNAFQFFMLLCSWGLLLPSEVICAMSEMRFNCSCSYVPGEHHCLLKSGWCSCRNETEHYTWSNVLLSHCIKLTLSNADRLPDIMYSNSVMLLLTYLTVDPKHTHYSLNCIKENKPAVIFINSSIEIASTCLYKYLMCSLLVNSEKEFS